MSQINPFAGSILQSTQAQRTQAADRDRQVRRAHETVKHSALAGDQLEHQVEGSEELTPIHEDQRHERRFKRPTHHNDPSKQTNDSDPDGETHLDLTA